MIKTVALCLASILGIYGAFAYISLEPNVFTWGMEARYWHILLSFGLTAGIVLVRKEKPRT